MYGHCLPNSNWPLIHRSGQSIQPLQFSSLSWQRYTACVSFDAYSQESIGCHFFFLILSLLFFSPLLIKMSLLSINTNLLHFIIDTIYSYVLHLFIYNVFYTTFNSPSIFHSQWKLVLLLLFAPWHLPYWNPSTTISRLGFDAVAKVVKSQETHSSLGRSMHIEPVATAYPHIQPFSDSESESPEEHSHESLVWGGYYFLCFCYLHEPKNGSFGWVVGYGSRQSGDGGVDIRLHMKRPTPTRLSSFHAKFHFSQMGMFSLAVYKDGRSITLGGTTYTSASRVFDSSEPTSLQFAEFVYSFRFTDVVSTSQWRMACEEYMKGIDITPPPNFVNPTTFSFGLCS